MYDNVAKWAAIRNADFNMNYYAMGPKLKAEPKGVVLITSAFNIPLFFTLGPLVRPVPSNAAVRNSSYPMLTLTVCVWI